MIVSVADLGGRAIGQTSGKRDRWPCRAGYGTWIVILAESGIQAAFERP